MRQGEIERTPAIAVVIVTFNHGRTIGATLQSVLEQSLPVDCVVIDCGSSDTTWAQPWINHPRCTVTLLGENAGFTGANNLGWRRVRDSSDFVLFLNPDVIVPGGLLARLSLVMRASHMGGFAAVSPRLVKWDFEENRTTGQIDSTGIFPGRWGGWADRRDAAPPLSELVESVPALCGAFFLARTHALRAVELADGSLWDRRYFAYKEDIELSLRLRRSGWHVGVWHGGEVGHGRGWQERRSMPREARLLSARNEIRLHRDYAPFRLPFSIAKWLAVRLLDL